MVCYLWFLFISCTFTPVSLLHNSVIEGEDFDEDKTDGWPLNSKFSTTMKSLDIVGEALPQLSLNVVLILNNFPYLEENDVNCGIPISESKTLHINMFVLYNS